MHLKCNIQKKQLSINNINFKNLFKYIIFILNYIHSCMKDKRMILFVCLS